MIGTTLFSGIGAPETAMPHWHWPWHAEIEKFPSAVMAQRHPQSVNLGDVTADDFCERAAGIARPDVLVFGSPCQDFSVAGKRLGLAGARGNMALIALGIVGRIKPRWFVFENVPGLLSNWSGAEDGPIEAGAEWESVENGDFAAFLGAVDELRYSGAWAMLDAQYSGVAQRRERLFFVGHSGDWRGPAAVLLEPESLCGNSPPRRETGTSAAGALATGARKRGGYCNGADEAAAGQLIAHALRAEGFDASEDGTGRGTPLVAGSLPASTGGSDDNDAREGRLIPFGGNDTRGSIDIATAVNAHGGPHGRMDFESETIAVAFDTTQITSGENRCRPEPGDPSHPLPAHGHAPAIAFQCHGSNVGEMGTLRQGNGNITGGVPFLADPITASFAKHKGATAGKDCLPRNHIVASGVRRLTPRECERLQGYPDDYTLITYRGKPAADGPRYKALGNSMAVPVMKWILSRIEQFEDFNLAAPPPRDKAVNERRAAEEAWARWCKAAGLMAEDSRR